MPQQIHMCKTQDSNIIPNSTGESRYHEWTFIFQVTMFAVSSPEPRGLRDRGVRKESAESRVTPKATCRARATLRVTPAPALTRERSSESSLRHWTTPASLWKLQTTSRVSRGQWQKFRFSVFVYFLFLTAQHEKLTLLTFLFTTMVFICLFLFGKHALNFVTSLNASAAVAMDSGSYAVGNNLCLYVYIFAYWQHLKYAELAISSSSLWCINEWTDKYSWITLMLEKSLICDNCQASSGAKWGGGFFSDFFFHEVWAHLSWFRLQTRIWILLPPLANNDQSAVFSHSSRRSRPVAAVYGRGPFEDECESDSRPPWSTWPSRITRLQPRHRVLRQRHSWPHGLLQKWGYNSLWLSTYCIWLNLAAMENNPVLCKCGAGKCCFIATKICAFSLAQPMAPSPVLQEALDQREKEGTQDPKETRVHFDSDAFPRVIFKCIHWEKQSESEFVFCVFTGDPGHPGLAGLPGSYTIQIPHRVQKRDIGKKKKLFWQTTWKLV